MPDCALPGHLKGKLHNDWIWPMCYIPRGWTAFGHRCANWLTKWRQFPLLLIGYGVRRWKTATDSTVYHEGCRRWAFWIKERECGPDPLQKLTPWSFQIAWPLHFSFHIKMSERILMFVRRLCKYDPYDGLYSFWGFRFEFKDDFVFLIRKGCRWDPYDGYYNCGINDTLLAILIWLLTYFLWGNHLGAWGLLVIPDYIGLTWN